MKKVMLLARPRLKYWKCTSISESNDFATVASIILCNGKHFPPFFLLFVWNVKYKGNYENSHGFLVKIYYRYTWSEWHLSLLKMLASLSTSRCC